MADHRVAAIFLALALYCLPAAGADIHDSVRKGDIESVKAVLEKQPGLLNARDSNGRTPLLESLFSGQPAIFDFLLGKGADIDLPDNSGLCPLHLAAFRGDAEGMKRLLDSKAKINAKTNTGVTPLHAATRGGHRAVLGLLISRGASLDEKNAYGETALLLAAALDRREIVRDLISAKADLETKDSLGSTALLIATLNGHRDLAAMLLDLGAAVGAKNSRGSTPLSVAEREGYPEIAALLLARGAKRESSGMPAMRGNYLGQKTPGLAPEVFAPGIVSTEKKELNSVFTPDGREFYFTVQDFQGRWTVMVMKRLGEQWTKPQTASFSGRYSDVDLFISPDGQKLFYCSNRPMGEGGGPKGDFDLWVVERAKDGWSVPVNLGSPVNSQTDEFYPAVTASGTLYFQSERADCKGQKDIYRAVYKNGGYDTVENVGEPVNSPFFESDAYVSPRENLVIFSSNLPDSLGQGDLYISFRDSAGKWTRPLNMGNLINTEAHENCPMVSPDGRFFFFTRQGDIFWMDAGVIGQLQKRAPK